MTLFLPTLNQMGFLMLLIAIGYLLTRLHAVPDNTTQALSKLENNLFIPALVLGTFMQKFTVSNFKTSGLFLLVGLMTAVFSIPLALLTSHFCTKDTYVKKIYAYGLAFSNFGFMGNAVVQALFPDIFMEYLVFTLPLWAVAYMWGAPTLLIPREEGAVISLKSRLKPLLNPMFVATILGMILGLISPPVPDFINSTVTSLGNCMSPIAMLLTGMTIAKIDIKKILRIPSVYVITLVKLLVFPAIGFLLFLFVNVPQEIAVCTMCVLAMPTGLSNIVIPSGYGMDTSVASGLALISHLLSCISIPLVFMLFQTLVL